jgi:hypothetical protein
MLFAVEEFVDESSCDRTVPVGEDTCESSAVRIDVHADENGEHLYRWPAVVSEHAVDGAEGCIVGKQAVEGSASTCDVVVGVLNDLLGDAAISIAGEEGNKFVDRPFGCVTSAPQHGSPQERVGESAKGGVGGGADLPASDHRGCVRIEPIRLMTMGRVRSSRPDAVM